MWAGYKHKVELMGLWTSLTLAHRLNITQLLVLGDSKIVIDWINHNCSLKVTNLMGWMSKIRDLSHSFKDIKFDHIYREENMESDALSKLALQVLEGKIHYIKWLDGHEGRPLSLCLYI